MHTEEARKTQTNHRVTLEDRSTMTVSGVTEVVSFDEETVVLDTVLGRLTIEGSSLHIQTLDVAAGIVSLSGRIDGLGYESVSEEGGARQGGIFSRLFH